MSWQVYGCLVTFFQKIVNSQELMKTCQNMQDASDSDGELHEGCTFSLYCQKMSYAIYLS